MESSVSAAPLSAVARQSKPVPIISLTSVDVLMIIFVSPVCVNILNFTVINHPDLLHYKPSTGIHFAGFLNPFEAMG